MEHLYCVGDVVSFKDRFGILHEGTIILVQKFNDKSGLPLDKDYGVVYSSGPSQDFYVAISQIDVIALCKKDD